MSAAAVGRDGFRYFDFVMAAFVAILLLSNVIGAAKPAQLWGFTFGAGILFFPLSYVIGDVLTEVYGYGRARRCVWVGFCAVLFMAFMSWVVVSLPSAPGWAGQAAYESVFGQVPRIVFASVVAFWAGEFVNAFVLAKMKVWTKGKHLWSRTIGSTFFGQGVDSLLFYPLAFGGVWETATVVQVMRRDTRAIVGMVLIIALVGAAIFAPLLTSYDPTAIDLGQQLLRPSRLHWLGTDIQGRDILARLLFGARISLSVGLGAQTLALLVGGTLGLASGFYGRWVDELVMRIADVTLAFPTLLLLIAMVAAFQPSITVVTITIGIVGWAGVARLVRGQVMVVRNLEYVQAARALGGSDVRILLRHVLPAVTAPLVIVGTLGIAAAIMAESSLSFLGLGVQPPTPSWGGMIADARDLSQLRRAPWTSVAPGLTIGCAVLAFNLLGDALRDATDPRQLTRRLARQTQP